MGTTLSNAAASADASLSTSFTAAAATSGVPAYSHIVVVVMENHGFSQIIGDTVEAPYINALAGSNALLTNYTAISHPSEPNYFSLYAGSTFGISDDNHYVESGPTLATILQGAGKTFTGYVEGGASSYDHNPWESFSEGFTVEKDFSTFPSSNFTALPTVSFVIPNTNDDMHNGTIAQGDAWLQANLDAYAQWAKANNSLLVVTWDENDGANGNQVATILAGADVNPGTYNTAYNHYNLLSTLLAASNLTGPGNAATAAPIGGGVFSSTTACFASGTRILTTGGEVAVEALAVGCAVPTLSGRVAPVRWLGHRSIDCARHSRPQDVWPVRVRAGAFAEASPLRDLLLSPDHSVFIEGVLIPIRHLVNGATIAQERADRITYWHVELPGHAVLLAEGLPVESYLDTGNRAAFANGGAVAMAQADFARGVWQTRACARLVVSGPVLEAARVLLLHRATALGHAQTDDPDLHLIAGGQALRPEIDGPVHRFTLPAGIGEMRIVSRSVVPAQLYPDGADTRRLGVAVSFVTMDDVEVRPGDPRRGRGWHAPEASWQWTDGDASLDCAGARRLEITVAAMARYWRRDAESSLPAAAHS